MLNSLSWDEVITLFIGELVYSEQGQGLESLFVCSLEYDYYELKSNSWIKGYSLNKIISNQLVEMYTEIE